jgi:hypothetical protein
MPFNGSGTFTRVYNWVTDKVNGVNITASRVDTEDDGFATGLTNCVTRDGQGKMGADFTPAVTATYYLGTGGFTWLGINGIAITDFARLSVAGTNTASNPAARYSSAVPAILLDQSNAAADNRKWRMVPLSEQWRLTAINDAEASESNAIEIDRTGIVIDSVNLKATSVQANGISLVPLSTFKAASTSRNTTTTFASDPDLSFTNVPIGTYEIEGVLFFDCTTAPGSNGGLKSQLSFSGTVANGIVAQIGSTGTNTVISNAYASVSGGVIAINNMSSASATATGNWIQFRGTVTLSTIQNVALQWAQSSSDSDPTILQVMSRLTLRRVA